MKEITYEKSHKKFNGVLYKLCSKCRKWLPCTTEYFYKTNSKNPKGDKLFPYCKECSKEKARSWRRKPENRDKWLEINKIRNSNPNKRQQIRELMNKYREEGRQLEWQQNNKDKIKQYSEVRSNKNHTITSKEWNICKEYFNNSCAYCGMTEKEHREIFNQDLHKEHVECEGANDLSNCVPACRSCNSSKNIFQLTEWYNKNNPKFNQEKLDVINKWLSEDYKKIIK
ncbi:HNH endonuclease family protein (plasmid) [Clostridium botulinum]|uniref:HNH endonuclease n=1 Tax=Clostridium botulinum TaxID=1491 RepID=UPI0004633875|nr:HNH endonuclease [Clostridium botulinum]APR02374.1 HNH endonuclease family protein [Clostridium botulinum]MBN3359248.1 HNH endonuclease [Clostridium botulinum]MBN3402892.1 HNH endonuclease [Clostridium botulinum]MBN3447599.1 HNH endonuclease [Clostridium botulinum]QDY27097.1 HNH endonuclease [Clostridium botulinum]